MLIKSLFDPSKDILRHHRAKVITYGAAQEVRLRAEIAETIVTDSMEAQFEELRTNNSFKPVGEAVRASCPFLPNKIPKPALDHFHRRQSRVQWRA